MTVKNLRFTLIITFTSVVLLLKAQDGSGGGARSVSGIVTGTDGQGLPGVSVVLKGSTLGAQTDIDGRYTLEVNPEGSLVFSFVGMQTITVKINGKDTIDVSMKESTTDLNSVVVTALGIGKDQRKVGYSISEVGATQFAKAKEVNFANSLSGVVAGLSVKGTSGGAGGTSRILLRGLPSMSSSGSPLIVIDGIPMDNTQRGAASEFGGSDNGDGLGNLNSDDIEKVTVLKGQSASSLYGARASNGVIMVTTKKGTAGTWQVSYNGNTMFESVYDLTNFQSTYGQGVNGAKPSSATDALNSNRLAWGSKLDGSDYVSWNGSTQKYTKASKNYSGFYRTGYNISNTFSTTKGWKDGSIRLSVGNVTSQSMLPNTGLDRYTVNLNAEQKMADRLTVTAMANYISQKNKNNPFLGDGSRNPNNFIFLAPNVNYKDFSPGYDSKGNEIQFSDDQYVTNPYFATSKAINDVGRSRLISMLSTKYDFVKVPKETSVLKRLDLTQVTGYDLSSDDQLSVEPTGLAYTNGSKGNYNGGKTLSQRSELNLALNLSSNLKFDDLLEIDALVGGNIRKNKYEMTNISGNLFVLPFFYAPTNVTTIGRNYDLVESQVNSGYYSADVTVKSMLTLSTTGRFDQYSSLPSSSREIFTPSFSGGFIFSELTKYSLPFLNFGKLRASYAITSGEPAPYQTSYYYDVGRSLDGKVTGTFPLGLLPNVSLKPFTLHELEGGLELKLFEQRVDIDLAIFQRTTYNEIMNSVLPSASGYTGGVVATGSTQNTGLELMVKGVPVQTENFLWSTSVNFTSVSNKILETDDLGNRVSLGTIRPYGFSKAGFLAYEKGLPGPQIKAYDYKRDGSGNIVLDSSGLPQKGELINAGSVLPKFYGGWNNQFSYKNISLSFLIDYNFGNKVFSGTEVYSWLKGLNQGTLPLREQAVPAAAGNMTSGEYAQKYYTTLANNVSVIGVVPGDFIKLRQITLGYDFPNRWFTKIALIDRMTLSVVGRNLLILWKEAENIDPEATFGSSISYAGLEGLNLPSSRSYGLNLNIRFK